VGTREKRDGRSLAELQVIDMGRLKYRVTLTAKETAELERLVRELTAA